MIELMRLDYLFHLHDRSPLIQESPLDFRKFLVNEEMFEAEKLRILKQLRLLDKTRSVNISAGKQSASSKIPVYSQVESRFDHARTGNLGMLPLIF